MEILKSLADQSQFCNKCPESHRHNFDVIHYTVIFVNTCVGHYFYSLYLSYNSSVMTNSAIKSLMMYFFEY